MLALACLLLAGCGGEQTVYTESEIIQYVKDVYGEDYRLTDTDHTVLPDGTVRDDYIFAEEDGISFMVSTSSRTFHNRFGFVTSGSPVLSDGYLDAVIGCRQQDLQRLFEDSDLDARLVRTGGGNYDCCFPRCAAVFSGLAIHLHGTCYVAANARYGPKIAIGHFRVTLGGKVEQVAAQRFGSKVEYLSIIIRDRYTFVRVSYCIDFFAQSLVILRYIFGVLSERGRITERHNRTYNKSPVLRQAVQN